MPWKLLLAKVPWNEVIRNAPTLIDAARKLWSQRVKPPITVYEPPADSVTAEQQLLAMQKQITELRNELQAAGDVIQRLAEQNGLMIARMEKTRRRLLILTVFTLILAGILFWKLLV